MTETFGIVRIMVALSLWIVAIMAILSCLLNGLTWSYLLGAMAAWLLAFWIWPRQRQQQRRAKRNPQHQDWSGAFDALDLIFALIEWPLRLLFWMVRHLDDVIKAVD